MSTGQPRRSRRTRSRRRSTSYEAVTPGWWLLKLLPMRERVQSPEPEHKEHRVVTVNLARGRLVPKRHSLQAVQRPSGCEDTHGVGPPPKWQVYPRRRSSFRSRLGWTDSEWARDGRSPGPRLVLAVSLTHFKALRHASACPSTTALSHDYFTFYSMLVSCHDLLKFHCFALR